METFLYLEVAGVLFWAIYLILVVRENIWCWPFAIIAASITIFLFFQAKIYMEAILNVYYVIAACYGWFYWTKGRQSSQADSSGNSGKQNKVPVSMWSLRLHIVSFLITAAVAYGLGTLSKVYTDAPRPYVDASLASFSFLATLMETRKILTCWVYWFIVNIGLVILQVDREIYLYAGLSLFFVVMSVNGFITWSKSLKWAASNT